MSRHRRLIAAAGVVLFLLAGPARAQMPSFASLFDPLQVLNLNIQLDPSDWDIIRNDTSYSIERPGYFWADDESKILVAVRRKPTNADGDKVSLKIDIDQYFDSLRWHGVNKLSLENGYDKSPVAEGLAFYLHRVAASDEPYGYQPPLASWVNVTVNGQNLGVYANVEQVDKAFLRNRDLWVEGQTWLYKQGEIGPPELRQGPGDASPTFNILDYSPFRTQNPQPTPPPEVVAAQLPGLINMHSMLTLGAINAFTGNQDELFTKGKNFFFADFGPEASGGLRMYFPWDLDAVFSQVDASIYVSGKGKNQSMHPYQAVILANPVFRSQYDQIMFDLLHGPMSVEALHDFLDELLPVLMPSLLADPYAPMGSTPGEITSQFSSLKNWIAARHANVLSQLPENMSHSSVPEPAAGLLALLAAAGLLQRRRGGD
jgi:spore coat protein H